MATQDDILTAKALLREAALIADAWPAALGAFARACGARTGQLIGLSGDGEIVAHVLTDLTPEEVREIEAFGLSDPVGNPRLRIGRHADILTPVADQDHVDPDMRDRHPIYEKIFDRLDLSFNCQTVLVREPDLLLRTSISRSAQQGPLDAENFRAFAVLSPHIQAAARTQLALEAAQARSGVRMLDALAAPGLLLDRTGRILAVSAAAETAMAEDRLFRRRGRNLLPVFPEDAPALTGAIDRALAARQAPETPPPGDIVVRGADGRPAFVLNIAPIPGDGYVLGLAPAVLIVARTATTPKGSAELVMGAWNLSRAEADIAVRLAEGQTLETIAEVRGSTLATVRSQLQAIYAKASVHRQAELVAAVLSVGAV
jgi:DNA-binding CsgD family transcriptional regulator/PAS domain-containing protein